LNIQREISRAYLRREQGHQYIIYIYIYRNEGELELPGQQIFTRTGQIGELDKDNTFSLLHSG